MNKEVYLHIGLQKTGTTALQNHLTRHSEILKNNGVLYPKSGRSGIKHDHLLESLNKQDDYDYSLDYWDALVEEICNSKANKVIISDEAFCSLESSKLLLVKNKLSSFDIKIIIYLREPSSFLISLYKYNIKSGNVYYSFREYINRNISRCNYEKIIRQYATCFSKENIIIKYYEEAKKIGILKDFIETINLSERQTINLTQLSSLKQINTALDDCTLKYLRELNKIQFLVPFFLGMNGRKIAKYNKIRNSLGIFVKFRLSIALQWIELSKFFPKSIKKNTCSGKLLKFCLYLLIINTPLYRESDLQYIQIYLKSLEQSVMNYYYPNSDSIA